MDPLGFGNPYGSRMGYHGNILLRTNWGRRGRGRKPNSVGETGSGVGRGRDRKPNFVACSARIVSVYGQFIFIWFYDLSFFILLFIIFFVFNFFIIAKWWWFPWVTSVGLVGESPWVLNDEVPATLKERWGRVGRMMAREWLVTLRVCGAWAGERCRVP